MPFQSLLSTLRAIPVVVARALLGLFGLVFMLSMLLFALLAGVLLVGWALLRGRRPVWHVGGMPRAGAWRAAQQRSPSVDVIEVEAREVDSRASR